MKVVYLNKETGKEVHYGENITFKESGKFANGYSYQSETTLPIINATIPDLIKKGVLIQKEVKDKKSINKPQAGPTIEKKLDILATAVSMLLKSVSQLRQDFYGEEDDEDDDD